MKIEYGHGKTEYGPGIQIELTGDEVAAAINSWLENHLVHIIGPRTVTVNDNLCEIAQVYVDPSGEVITPEGATMSGRGK